MSAVKKNIPLKPIARFPVVGIGASAGGLDPFKRFVGAITATSGMAYVLVQHLAPDHESLLPQIIKQHTKLPVHQITDDLQLAPNHIYVLPENKILVAEDGKLKLAPRDLSLKSNMPIDLFLGSLAEVHQSFALGIVLSGTGFDGTSGLKKLKESGAITYAQSTDDAVFSAMPQNAIDSGAVDFVLLPEEMPNHLLTVRRAYTIANAYSDLPLAPDSEEIFRQILKVIGSRSGTDFSHYKQVTLRRRMARRMVATKNEEPTHYLKHLRQSTDEQELLFNDLLIPVSFFFRDSESFDALSKTVFPHILSHKQPGDMIRVWIAGCSTGEEAYSVAICLHEFLRAEAPGVKAQIFATDLTEKVITKARAGKYAREELQNVSETRLHNYFDKINNTYHVSKVIREMCIFAIHDLIKDPPFSRIDLLTCRNVLVYFDQPLQKKVLSSFHYALKDTGMLFLGKSESTEQAEGLFEPVSKQHKIYIRTRAAGKRRFEPPMPANRSNLNNLPDLKNIKTDTNTLAGLAQSALLTRYSPAAVIIDGEHQILHIHGDTAPFLVHSAAKTNLNLIRMAREGLEFELQRALLKQRETKSVIAVKGIKCARCTYTVDFDISPLTPEAQHLLVVFHKIAPSTSQNGVGEQPDSDRILELESELTRIHADIRKVTANQEAVHEKLQNANEELLTASEELRTLNEELETSAEELQSNNEELSSVNDELVDRQDQLISARIEAEAIIDTIREPIVILNSAMRIKSANTSFYNYFQIDEKEMEGVSIFDIGNGRWSSPELRELMEHILPDKSKVVDHEISGTFNNLGQRTLIVNARQIINKRNPEQFVLLAFEDVTERKISNMLTDRDENFRIMANTAPALLWLANDKKEVTFFNQSWLDYTGRSIEQEKGQGWIENVHPDDRQKMVELLYEGFAAKIEFTFEFRLRRYDSEYRWITAKAVPRLSSTGTFTGFAGGCMDMHEQKNFYASLEEKVEKRTKELRESEEFLQSILNTTQNLIYLYDFQKEKIVFINKKSLEATGYTSEEIEESDIDLFSPLIHPFDLAQVYEHRRTLKGSSDAKMSTIEFRLKNKDGDWTCQLSRDVVFKRDRNGNVIQYIGVATDISEIKNANEQLTAKNQELEYSNTELASFSSIASHDLKEPLRKIQVFSKLVLAKDKANVSAESQDFLDRVIISANRMQQLIDDLISYSRTSSQKIVFVESDLNKILDEVLDDIKELLVESKTKIDIAEMPFAPVIPSQFRQLFLNLISNAIKYSRADALPHIRIYTEKTSRKEIAAIDGDTSISYLKVVVSDNGIGFAEEFRTRIFEPFQRLHGKDEYSGTGIGLAICKKILLNHKGFIFAEGQDGQGATFYIYVPDGR